MRMNAASLVDMEPASTHCCKKLSSRNFKLAEESRKSAQETLYEASSSNLKQLLPNPVLGLNCITKVLVAIHYADFTSVLPQPISSSFVNEILIFDKFSRRIATEFFSQQPAYAEMIGSSLGFQAVRRRQRLKNVGSSACLSKNTAVFKDLSKAENACQDFSS